MINGKTYQDILYMKRPEFKNRPKMSRINRAAQFAPFAALTGYEESVHEKARLVDKFVELTNEEKLVISDKLHIVESYIGTDQKFYFTYFIPDNLKNGGRYETTDKKVKKIDEDGWRVVFEDNTDIAIGYIIDINSDIFEQIYMEEQ